MMKASGIGPVVALLTALSASVMLAGCGQKGPLFLPGEAPQSQTQEPPSGMGEDTRQPQSSRPNQGRDDGDR